MDNSLRDVIYAALTADEYENSTDEEWAAGIADAVLAWHEQQIAGIVHEAGMQAAASYLHGKREALAAPAPSRQDEEYNAYVRSDEAYDRWRKERNIESCPICGGIMEHVVGCENMDKPR